MLNMADIIQNTHPQSILYINGNEKFNEDFAVYGRNKKMEERLRKELLYEKNSYKRRSLLGMPSKCASQTMTDSRGGEGVGTKILRLTPQGGRGFQSKN